MKAQLVRIGNSQGVRIPKALIQQCGLEGEVEMTVRDNMLVIAKGRVPREGWDEAFARMAAAGDDAPLIPDSVRNRWDETEWQW
jgi:antitoxin MazE